MFKKEHDVLICIDSDGTIMDTMTIKHVNCFGPAFVDIFSVNENREDILKHWNETNLYTMTRGINRFQGLKEILIYCSKKYNFHYQGAEAFYHWVDTTPAFSITLLKEEGEKIDSETIQKAILWNDEVNRRIRLLPENKMFENVYETLLKLREVSDLVGVSSANKDAVFQEWEKNGILPLFKEVCCQDKGSKTAIIKESKKGYLDENVIMVGDALGDLEASRNSNCLFYPIIPSKEKDSWKELGDIVSLIKDGKYKDLEEKYINEFKEFLGGNQ